MLEVGADKTQRLSIGCLHSDDESPTRIGLPLRRGLGVGQRLDEFIENRQTREHGIAKESALVVLRGAKARREAGQLAKFLQLMHAARTQHTDIHLLQRHQIGLGRFDDIGQSLDFG